MVAVNKIDSNQTGLRFAEETSLGVLPGSPVWHPMEPNSYADFGGSITTVARNPINASRQRQKGVTTDLDASGGLESDLTQTNFERLSQGFFFADIREKFDTAPLNSLTPLTDVSTDGTANDYRAAAFGIGVGVNRRVQSGSLLLAAGFATAANNGLKVVSSITADTNILVTDTGIETEAAEAGQRVQVVGHQFGSGVMNVNSTVNDLPRLELVGLVTATGVYTLAANVANNDTVTIGTQTYTFKTTLTPAVNEVLIGASASISIDNLIAAINAAAGSGTLYGAGTVANAHVTAAPGAGDTMDLTAKKAGAIGNTVATTEVGANSSFGAATLTGGVGTAFDTLGLIPGEWIFIGGDSASLKFVNTANNNWARVKTIASAALTLDKTTGTMADETGTGLTIQLFFGAVVKNEADPTLIRRRSYQLERTLGASDDALPTQIQSEYLVGAVANELSLNFATADKVTMNLSFVATNNEQRTGSTGLKSGTRPNLVASDAFNTSNHFSRLKLSILDPLNSNPTALFGFVTEFTITVNNNVTPNKAISVLGAFDVTAGQFNVDGTVTAYFSNVTAVTAVRDNKDVTLDFAIVKDKAGILVDVPLIALGDGRLNVEQDQPITLPLNIPAAADRVFNHTLLTIYFHYLPIAAE